MNKTIIDNCNSRVKEDDLLIYLGDFCLAKSSEASDAPKSVFEKIREQIKCKNIIFIEGNHDRKKRNGLKTHIQRLVIHLGGQDIYCVHNPEFCSTLYKFNLVGHVHDKWKFKRYRKGMDFTDCCNVSVEQWEYLPITINEIDSEYHKWLKSEKLKC